MADSAQQDIDELARKDEAQYVHQVYETIASHFSSTRYKPWPGISQFFESLPAGSLGLDAGCGNGKYLGLRSVLNDAFPKQDQTNQRKVGSVKGKGRSSAVDSSTDGPEEHSGVTKPGSVLTIGLDRSSNLVKIAKERSHEVLVADAIDMPWREGTFDFAISIATIHHFTTPSRRKEAVRTMLRALNKQHGKLLIQVWAMEQTPPEDAEDSENTGVAASTHKPYLKRQRDMDKLESAQHTMQSLQLSQAEKQDVFVPWKHQEGQGKRAVVATVAQSQSSASELVYQRYYHLFRAGELRSLLAQAASDELGDSDFHFLIIDEHEKWESGNWSIVGQFRASRST